MCCIDSLLHTCLFIHSIHTHTVQGLDGKESEHSTAISKQHKDENRFGNILVCKFLRIFYTKFLLWIHAHTLTPWFPADDDNLIILDPIPGQRTVRVTTSMPAM